MSELSRFFNLNVVDIRLALTTAQEKNIDITLALTLVSPNWIAKLFFLMGFVEILFTIVGLMQPKIICS